MKLKYYLRGLGIGIIVTTIVLAISFSQRKVELSDEEIIARATQLGMVMQEDDSESDSDTVDTEQTSDAGATQTLETDDVVETNTADQMQDDGQTVNDDAATEEQMADDTVTEEQTADTVETENDSTGNAGTQATGETYRLVIKKGDVCRVVCENLAENGIISDAEAFRKYLFEIGYASNMSVGEYDIPYGVTQEEVAQILKAGPIE